MSLKERETHTHHYDYQNFAFDVNIHIVSTFLADCTKCKRAIVVTPVVRVPVPLC